MLRSSSTQKMVRARGRSTGREITGPRGRSSWRVCSKLKRRMSRVVPLRRKVVDNVESGNRAVEVVGLLADQRSERPTTFYILVGRCPRDSGRYSLNGTKNRPARVSQGREAGSGPAPGTLRAFVNMTSEENYWPSWKPFSHSRAAARIAWRNCSPPESIVTALLVLTASSPFARAIPPSDRAAALE